MFIESASGGQKPQFLANFDFWGFLYRPPFTNEGQIWYAIADLFTCQNLSRSVYSIAFWRRETLIFAVFWTSAFSDVDSCRQSEEVEHGCTTTNLPLSNDIKISSVLQRLHGEIGRTNSDVQKCDVTKSVTDRKSVTDKQKNSTFFATQVAGENRAPPNLAR